MSIVYKVGDVLKSDEKVIVHGCNCFNSMGAGIAAQIASLYPEAMLVDTLTKRGDKTKLGTYTFWTGKNKFHNSQVTIINAYTQYLYTRHEVDLNYSALLEVMNQICKDFNDPVIAMPRIGCGLAGGNWDIVSYILSDVAKTFNKTFHVYTLS